MKNKISLCMITRNEEEYLRQCLESVKGLVDEIILVDTGSSDKTKQIADIFNAKIFDLEWNDDFSAARNESLRHATKDWILVLDADELIEEKDFEKIKSAISNSQEISGFQLEQRSYLKDYFEGALKNNSGFDKAKEYPFYISNSIVRLFKNKIGLEFSHRIHELVEDSLNEKNLKYEKLDVIIHHFGSVKDKNKIKEKAEQYTALILKQLGDNPESARYNYQAARMFLGKNDFPNAIKHFKKTSGIDPSYKSVFSELAKIHLKMNDREKAIEYFKKSIKHNPENPSPANNLAVVYMSIGNFSEAKKILEWQLKKHPNNKALIYNYEEAVKNINSSK